MKAISVCLKIPILLFLFVQCELASAQQLSLKERIDTLIATPDSMYFKGVIIVTGKESCTVQYNPGYSKKVAPSFNQQFVIGSISKQFTAVLILREYDKGTIQLHTPIRKYLPKLSMSWADTVTIHQLLTHTHGIIELNPPAGT